MAQYRNVVNPESVKENYYVIMGQMIHIFWALLSKWIRSAFHDLYTLDISMNWCPGDGLWENKIMSY